MLWRTSPAATELEEVTLGWLRAADRIAGRVRRRHLRHGVDLDAARARRRARGGRPDVRAARARWRADAATLRVYCSEQAHSSVDKAVILARPRPRRAAHDPDRRRSSAMRPTRCARAIAGHRAAGVAADRRGRDGRHDVDHQHRPGGGDCRRLCARARRVAARRRRLCGRRGHAARARACASPAADRADSLVVNPHKWLFTPFDLSAFFCRRMDVLRAASRWCPNTCDARGDRGAESDGHRHPARAAFRALKLWMVLRFFGAAASATRLAEPHARWRGASRRGSTPIPTSNAWRRCPSAWSVSAARPRRCAGARARSLQ